MTASSHPPWVLVVDDNPVHLEQLAELLPEFGIPVVGTVDRGEKAVGAIATARAEGIQVDVVVMDVRMPGIGGLEATRLVRATFPQVQVLLYTAFAAHLEKLAGQVGAFAEIPKCAGINQLVDLIWQAHRSPPAHTPAAPSPQAASPG